MQCERAIQYEHTMQHEHIYSTGLFYHISLSATTSFLRERLGMARFIPLYILPDSVHLYDPARMFIILDRDSSALRQSFILFHCYLCPDRITVIIRTGQIIMMRENPGMCLCFTHLYVCQCGCLRDQVLCLSKTRIRQRYI